MKKDFWKASPLMGRTNDFGMSWAEVGLAQQALDHGVTLHTFFKNGSLKEDVEIWAFVKEIRDHLGAFIGYHKVPTSKNGDEEWILFRHDFAVDIDYNYKTRTLSVNTFTLDESAINYVRDLVSRRIQRKVTKGRVFVVASSDSGPYLHELGFAGEDFVPSNYRPEVLAEYRHVVEDLNNPDPCGRVIILDGPPGTGKTHMVRALLNEVPKGMFVLVPSNMVSSLGSPSFIKVLFREERRDYPLILIIEDADEALSSRKGGNLSEISALLNYGDGIFGNTINMRIVATTNVSARDLDEAVTRYGRLCRRIEVSLLGFEQANEVYLRLTDKPGPFTSGHMYSLGEIYAVAHGSGGMKFVPKTPKGKLGFQLDDDEPKESPGKALDEVGIREGEAVTVGDMVYRRVGDQLETARDLIEELEEERGLDEGLIDEDPEETPTYKEGYGDDDED